jgi:hypothetical protein
LSKSDRFAPPKSQSHEERARLVPRTVAVLCTLMFGVQAQAMTEKEASANTEKEASTNMMYFAFAMKQGEACEKMGFTGTSALGNWEQRNGAALVNALRKVEDYAVANQKLTREQAREVALGLFNRHRETFDREMAPSLGKASCMQFAETLRHYETRLIKE